MENMTEKDKMLNIIENYGVDSVEVFLLTYLDVYRKDFYATRLHNLIADLNDCLHDKINGLEIIKSVASERAYYLKTYLDGNMYTTKEAAEKHLPIQIKNAEAIIETCKNFCR